MFYYFKLFINIFLLILTCLIPVILLHLLTYNTKIKVTIFLQNLTCLTHPPSDTVHICPRTNSRFPSIFVLIHRQCTLLISLSVVGSQMAVKFINIMKNKTNIFRKNQ